MKKALQVVEQQKDYCRRKKFPMFMPETGICWACHKDIIPYIEDRASSTHVTGCPVCHRSYCD